MPTVLKDLAVSEEVYTLLLFLIFSMILCADMFPS